MHVGEDEEAQLLPHVHRVHSKVVLEPGNGDESVQLEGKETTGRCYSFSGTAGSRLACRQDVDGSS